MDVYTILDAEPRVASDGVAESAHGVESVALPYTSRVKRFAELSKLSAVTWVTVSWPTGAL